MCRPGRDRSRRGDGHVVVDSHRPGAYFRRDRWLDLPDPDGADGVADVAVSPRWFRDLLSGRGDMGRAKILRDEPRAGSLLGNITNPGQLRGSASRAFRFASVSVVDHGDVATAPGESFAGIRARAAVRRSAARAWRPCFRSNR